MQDSGFNDCSDSLALIKDESVHLVLVDAGKVFVHRGCDGAMDIFRECHRVLKPGGFLLGFSDPVDFHRATGAIEDCVAVGDFEMRDAITWSHPKSECSTNYGVTDSSTIIAMAQKKRIGTFVDNWIEFGVGLIDTSQTWGGKFPANVVDSMLDDRVEIARHLIRVFTKSGDKVLDPYPLTQNFSEAAISEGRQSVR